MVVSSPGAPAQRPPLRSHPAVPEAHAPRLPPPPGLSQREGHPGTARGVSGPPAAPSPRRWLEAGLRGRAGPGQDKRCLAQAVAGARTKDRAWRRRGGASGRSSPQPTGFRSEGPRSEGIVRTQETVPRVPRATGLPRHSGRRLLPELCSPGSLAWCCPGSGRRGQGWAAPLWGAGALSQALRVHPGPRARGGGPHVHMLRQSVLRSWGPSTPAVPRARPPPRPRHPLPPPRAAGARPSRAPGAEAAGRPLPAWRLAHGRGQHGSRLRLIKCPSLMSFSN